MLMLPLAISDRRLLEHCLEELNQQVPRLRAAMAVKDFGLVRGIAGHLRPTVGLLGLPKLFELSQELEYRLDDNECPDWLEHCSRFCELMEKVHFSLREQLAEN